jgi:purine-cytosine permease-like protein
MKLVDNWRSRLSDYSTVALAVSAATIALWSTLPADWLQHLPTEWVARATGVVSLFGLLGKFVKQDKQ